ncbi:12158_t:CDS:1, partial [Dentiscutata heterogama]
QLFDITSEMEILIDQQLHDYLSIILTEACIEKNENINFIDNLIMNQKTKIDKKKWCRECGKDNIDNSKRKCPQCNTKLPTITEIQQEIDQTISKKKGYNQTFNF